MGETVRIRSSNGSSVGYKKDCREIKHRYCKASPGREAAPVERRLDSAVANALQIRGRGDVPVSHPLLEGVYIDTRLRAWEDTKNSGAGGGSRTHMRKNPRRIFMPSTAFAARTGRFEALTSGLRSGLSLHPPPKIRGLGAARLVSTPSRRRIPSGLGSGLPLQVSPNLSSSASTVSRRALKFRSSPQRLPFRHARVAGHLQLRIIEHAA